VTFRNLRLALAPVAVLTGGLLMVSNASASIMGTLNTGSGGTVTVSLTSVIFNADPSSTPPGPPWNAEVGNGTSLSFVGCSGVLNSPGCLSATEAIDVNSPVTAGSIGENNFLTFAAHPNLTFSLLAIGPGSTNTNCAAITGIIGQSCSVFAGSPILLTDTAGGTQVSLAVSGKASDTGVGGLAGGGGSNYIGSFNDPLNGTVTTSLGTTIAATPVGIQQFFCPGGVCATDGRSIDGRSQSGNFFATTVPEPSSLFLGSLGIVMLLVGTRFRKSHGNRA